MVSSKVIMHHSILISKETAKSQQVKEDAIVQNITSVIVMPTPQA